MNLRPMAKVTRVTLFEREVRERLSSSAVELLLAGARVLSEGQVARTGAGGAAFYGTVMLTMDLRLVGAAVRERCDEATARRVAAMMQGDARITRRVRQLAAKEAGQVAGRPVRASASDVRVRAQGTSVFIDVDLEGTIPR
jgi:hypothetical protein